MEGTLRARRSRADLLLERAVQAVLVLFVVAAPHSIAATQTALVAGCVLWIGRMIAARRLVLRRTPIDLPVALFILWSLLSIATSYDPAHSADRARGIGLFAAFYLFASNIPSARFGWALSLALALSTIGNLVPSYLDRYEGRGIRIVEMRTRSPLARWHLVPGDTILAADGKPVSTLEELNAAFDRGEPRTWIKLTFQRGEGVLESGHRRKRVQRAGAGPERLGIVVATGRDYRSRGFFSHPVTYSEILQLAGAVAVGWAVAGARRRPLWAAGMALLAAGIAGAMVMTETRASLVSLGIASIAICLLRGVGRRESLAVALGVILLVAVGTVFILRVRNVAWIDFSDQSTTWRLTVWREGLDLIARHPLLGIGPDAAKVRWREWGLFDNGRLPPGHWHSTPLQVAVDRGIPALALWVWLVAGFFAAAGRLVRDLVRAEAGGGDWRATAAVLGAWGAVVGFIASSMVHFNWGDSEVVEIAWALMGIAFAVGSLVKTDGGPAAAQVRAAQPENEAVASACPAPRAPDGGSAADAAGVRPLSGSQTTVDSGTQLAERAEDCSPTRERGVVAQSGGEPAKRAADTCALRGTRSVRPLNSMAELRAGLRTLSIEL